ncbi:tetraspanin-8-like isoform X2 [Pseudoliparis swirei]|uniref:tetraspanin-8-like isoform X2 n=1 Tax=Pseudoliparis swirei TaxID=2059687 RepID=UPI0024BD8F60|nr:tetraspanin-8-like isoform X2 [Pseudoliparis swirei]
MGKVNACLTRSYSIVITLIAILSALMLAATLFTHGHIHTEKDEMETMLPSIQLMYSLTIITMMLTIIGMYGACKKKKWALIMFAIGMILGTLFFIATDIQVLVHRPQMAEDLQMEFMHSNGSDIPEELIEIQNNYQCCGLEQGYLDWGYNIPESCLCTEESTNPCVAAPRNSSLFEHMIDDQPIMIYEELSSVVLCIFILCQLNKKDDVPVVVYSAEAKAGNYAALTDAAEHA